MIDSYILLFFFAGILIINLDKIANPSSIHNFINVNSNIGLKQGTILIWLALYTQLFFFYPVFLLLHYGLFWSFFFTIIMLIFIHFIINKINSHLHGERIDKPVLYQIYERKLTNRAFKPVIVIIFIANLDGFLLQLPLAALFFDYFSPNLSVVFICLLVLFSIIIAALGGMYNIYLTGYIFLLTCGGILLFIPLLLYLKTGIHHIFLSFHEIQFEQNHLFLIFLTSLFVLMGILLSHMYLWQVLSSIKQNYKKNSVTMSVFCFAALPLSMILLTVYMIATYQNSSLIGLVREYLIQPTTAISLLVILVWLFSVINTVIFSTFALAQSVIFLRHQKLVNKMGRSFYYILLISCFILTIIMLLLKNYLPVLLMAYLLTYIVISLPFWIMLNSKCKRSLWFPLAIILIWFVSLGSFIFYNQATPAIFVAIIGTVALSFISKLVDFIK